MISRARTLVIGRELALIGLAALVYAGVRTLTEGSVAHAVANGEWLFALEHRLGIAWEHAVQATIVGHWLLIDLANWVYIWGHWPVIVTVAVLLYVCRPTHYRLLRNAMFVSGLVGFLFFALVPMAPPRLIDAGLIDTVLQQSTSYRTLQPPALTNQYAAMPSLHFGWNLLVGIVVFFATTNLAIRGFAVLSPLLMGWAVIATANHYVLDVVAGGVIVLAALAGVLVARSRRAPATIDARERRLAHTDRPDGDPVPDRASRGQRPRVSTHRPAARPAARGGGRAPLSRPPRGAAPEDGRARPDPVGPVGAS